MMLLTKLVPTIKLKVTILDYNVLKTLFAETVLLTVKDVGYQRNTILIELITMVTLLPVINLLMSKLS